MNNIVFISGSESATKSQWLAEIQKQLINETIRLPEEISDLIRICINNQ